MLDKIYLSAKNYFIIVRLIKKMKVADRLVNIDIHSFQLTKKCIE